jgi:exonuclease SbcC
MLKLKSLKCIGFKGLNISNPLEFPEGRLLIYGRNESGKSTIMEAIHYALYGQGLRPSKRASNDDLIHYSLPRASIELAFTIDDNLYTVRRILSKRGTNRHELLIERPDGTRDRGTGARKVSELLEKELHGIDSEALLNSCLVEQKELGKLESASRPDRIHTMTSLLNLEAFIEAQQALNKKMNELERNNHETENRLEKAERAKKLYDEATQKLEQAESRIETIEQALNGLTNRINELDETLATFDKIKNLDTRMKELGVLLDGRQRELKRATASLNEIIEEEKQAAKIEEMLPPTRSKLDEAQRKVNALDKILALQVQIDNAHKEAERARERLENASKRVEEVLDAKKRIDELAMRIQEMEPAKKAQGLLPRIEETAQNLNEVEAEATRLQKSETELKSRLDTLKEVDKQINGLEQQEHALQIIKSSISKKRTIGLIMTVVGLVASLAAIASIYLLVIGLPLTCMGIVYAWRNSPTALDAKFTEIRMQREKTLGEKARIDEYTGQMEENRKCKDEQNKRVTTSRQKLLHILAQLPSKPRDYSEYFGIDDQSLSDSLTRLRSALQKDLESLTRLSTSREEAMKIVTELEDRRQAMEEETVKHRQAVFAAQSLEESKSNIMEIEHISSEQEVLLRSTKDTLQKTVQELEIRLGNVRQKASQKGKLEADQETLKASIETLDKERLDKTKERTELQLELGIDLGEEKKLRQERDKRKNETGSLETEKKEREADVKELNNVRKENKELSEEYPSLKEQNIKEKFEVESMRRSTRLLEVTRDGIMAGVKGRIETHMMRFLPSLTAQRYSMARIDEKDYRIEVYDRVARRWRGKGVFSGATQDQFSLALRLAFALSTIPSSRGARPGFIFLDEPLSGFDSERRDGLLNLLKGELSKYFDQIIVVSHLESLREEFPEQIQLEAGQVATHERLGTSTQDS